VGVVWLRDYMRKLLKDIYTYHITWRARLLWVHDLCVYGMCRR